MVSVARKISSWVCERQSLPYRFRKSIVKKIDPSLLSNHDFKVDFFGMKYEGNAGNYIERMIYFCGAYEKYMLFCLRDYVKSLDNENLSFWDIGANVGNHSLFMSQITEEVHAFEPYILVRKQFEKNIALNNIKNINIHPVGLSNINESIAFYAPPEGKLGNGSFVEGCNDGNEYHTELQVVIGDEEVEKKGINPPDIIKIDVEGFESSVLDGLKNTISNARPLIILELSPETRKSFGSFEGMKSSLPDEYCFFRFSKASRDGGEYKIADFEYDRKYRRSDVIACPEEMVKHLSNKCFKD